MHSYRLRPGWSLSSTTDGELRVFDEDREIIVRAPSGMQVMLEALTRALPPPPSMLDAILELERRGAVVKHDPGRDPHARASRQLEYFEAFTNDPEVVQHHLESRRLLIVGLGGTGSEFLRHMVAVGVQNYFLIDQDVVDVSNFNRQSLYERSDLGRPKVDAAQRFVSARLRSARCDVLKATVRADDDFALTIETFEPSLVFVAIDEPVETIGRDLSLMMDRMGVPYLIAGVGIRHGRVHAVSSAPDPSVPVAGTPASLTTTNAMVAAQAAHRAVEFLTGMRLPFEVHDG